ncbi:MAG: hypothetical protein LLG01_15130 [Planctomycetaceae bacterium]|nr:hypothetical protein [Planctomycetaceae bacterium]
MTSTPGSGGPPRPSVPRRPPPPPASGARSAPQPRSAAPAPAQGQAQRPAYTRGAPPASRTGWIIGGLMVLAVVGIVLAFLVTGGGTAGREKTTNDMIKLMKMDMPPAIVVDSLPTNSGNAGDDYALAAKLLKDNYNQLAIYIGDEAPVGPDARRDYGIVRGNEDEAEVPKALPEEKVMALLQEIETHVKAGAMKQTMDYTFTHTPRQFKVAMRFDGAIELLDVAKAMDSLEVYYRRQNKRDQAIACARAEFVMGWHMASEGRIANMTQVGLEIQVMAVDGLKSIYSEKADDAETIKTLNTYVLRINNAKQRAMAKLLAIWNVNPALGDVLYIVENDQDPAWRAQGLLSLALVRYAYRKKGDPAAAEAVLDRYMKDPNPYLAAAASAARAFTQQDFNQVGAGN